MVTEMQQTAKRPLPEAEVGGAGEQHAGEAGKKPRLAEAPGAPATGAPATKKPSLSLEALEKAKRALQLQKELKEKLKKIPQLQKPASLAVPEKLTPPSAAAPPLIPPPPPAAFVELAPPAPPPEQDATAQPAPPAAAELFYDPRMRSGGGKARRPKATFEFIEQGELQRAADEFRLRARFGRDARPLPVLGPDSKPAGAEAGAAAAESGQEEVEFVPDVEPWDKMLLAHGKYEEDVPPQPDQPVALRDNKITNLVEHPVPIQPPVDGPPPAPQPLKLTTKEAKKLRTQRRQAREKEKRDLIRQGLLEPPKPKVKLSNLYRVLGEQAVLDPTAIEKETRKQMAERRAAHEDRNVARSLTPAERKEKKIHKLFGDADGQVITSVFRIGRLDNAQNRYKVDVNAKENHMTGVLLLAPDFALVIVEGGRKATKRYTKLMLRRIDWDAPPLASRAPGMDGGAGTMAADAGGGGDGDGEGDDAELPPNHCHLVWQGLVREPAFKGFKAEPCRTTEHAQQVLAMHNVRHYWDAAKHFVPGDSVGLELE